MADLKKIKIAQLIPDDRNNNKGTQFGQHLVEKSISTFGAGRSILIDKNNRIIAGNKMIENAGALGFEEVIVVPTNGRQIVAVQRTDVDLNTKFGREMAIADNASAKEDISFDLDVVEDLAMEFEFDPSDWGISLDDQQSEEDPGHTTPSGGETHLVVKSSNNADLMALSLELSGRGFRCELIE